MPAPVIRFKTFNDEWQIKRLKDIVENKIVRNGPSSNAPIMMVTSENGFINQSERYSFDNAGQSLKKYILLNRGEMAYNHGASKLRPYGSCFSLNVDEARIPYVYHCFSLKNDNPEFVSFELNNEQVANQLRQLVTSGARMDGLLNISFEEYCSVALFIPSVKEQKTLADFFYSFNSLITANQQKLEKLKTFKKSMLQKMFPQAGADVPEIRFKGFIKPWKPLALKDFVEHVTSKNTDMLYTEVFTNSAEYGIISQRDFFDHDIAKYNKINDYYVVKPEDFVYNPRISVSAPVGPINRNALGRTGVMSPLYTVFRPYGMDNVFLEQFFKSSIWHSFMKFNGDSGARSDRFSIRNDVFYEMPVPCTNIEEQYKIGEYLSSLDSLISLQSSRIDKLLTLKKSLLERMFC